MSAYMIPLVLVGCVPVILILFATRPPRRALILSMVASWLIIPSVGFSLPGVPDLTKWSAPTTACLLGIALFDTARLVRFRPRWYDAPVLVLTLAAVLTSLDNGLGLYDGVSNAISRGTHWLLPYLFGRLYLTDLDGVREFAYGVTVGGLAYVLPCFWEMRFSPNLQLYVYGVAPGGWDLARYNLGYRPIVFMASGLETSLWMAACAVISYWLWVSGTVRTAFGFKFGWVAAALVVTAVLCKSVGALGIAAVAVAVLHLGRQFRTATPLVLMLVLPVVYMGLRGTGLWSAGETVGLVARVTDEGRAQSWKTRIVNEDRLSARALERPLLGWGGWSRGRVRNERGEDVSKTDGYWVILLGGQGLVGLTSWLLMFLLPPLIFIRRYPPGTWRDRDVAPAVVFAVTVTAYLIDCVANAMINPIYGIMLGSLAALPPRGPRRGGAADLEEAEAMKADGRTAAALAAYRRASAAFDVEADVRAALSVAAAAHEGIAGLTLDAGRAADAEAALRAAAAARESLAADRPDSADALGDLAAVLERLARLLAASGRWEEAKEAWTGAVSALEQAAAAAPHDPAWSSRWADASNDFAWLLAAVMGPPSGDPVAAVALARLATTLAPERPTSWNTLGAACYYAGDPRSAVDALNRSIELGGGRAADYLLLCLAYCRLGEADLAAATLGMAERAFAAGGGSAADPVLARMHEEAASYFAPIG